MHLAIPGFGALRLEHLVLDYNGTLAIDERLIPGVELRLSRLAGSLAVHVITADTFGKAHGSLRDVECTLQILKRGAEDRAKAADIVLHDVRDALELLLAPRRLLATLRS